jgi:hypothetical protein
MPSVAAVFVENLFDGEAGLASGKALAQLGKFRKPSLPVLRWVTAVSLATGRPWLVMTTSSPR